jgi:hypothetical protein
MLFSKANLQVAAVASTNPYDGGLNGVRIDPDGATVACDGNGLLAVGPARGETHFPDVGPQATPGEQGLVLPLDLVTKAESIIPKDKRISLQHVAMTVGQEPGQTEFTSVDKTGMRQRVALRPKRDRYPEWKKVVAKALQRTATGEADRGAAIRVCVSRKTLLGVLRALVDACPDAGDAPIFLEIGSGIVMRAVNRQTNQRVIGVASAYATNGQWLEKDEWERGVTEVTAGEGVTKEKLIRRLK